MKIYIVRHGQTDWNVQHRTLGRTDVSLNATGIEQVRKLRDSITDIKFDAVYASPLKRTAKTAEIATNNQYKIIYDDRLVERSFGDLEGQIVDNFTETTGYDIGDVKLNTNVANIEPVRNVLARTKAFLDDLKTRHSDDEVILVVTHGQVLRALHHNLVGYGDDIDWWGVGFENAEVREYTY